MKILALDTATQVASVAILSEERLIAENIIDHKLKHSKKLLPTLESLLDNVNLTYNDIDYFSIAVGPGSFTGLRIGLATVKALAQVTNKGIIPVSTLESLAYNVNFASGIICPILDARRSQVYTALFESDGTGKITRLTDDRALNLDELKTELKKQTKTVYLLGDGVFTYPELKDLKNVIQVSSAKRTCKASSVAQCALNSLDKVKTYKTLEPSYLRPSYAEEKK